MRRPRRRDWARRGCRCRPLHATPLRLPLGRPARYLRRLKMRAVRAGRAQAALLLPRRAEARRQRRHRPVHAAGCCGDGSCGASKRRRTFARCGLWSRAPGLAAAARHPMAFPRPFPLGLLRRATRSRGAESAPGAGDGAGSRGRPVGRTGDRPRGGNRTNDGGAIMTPRGAPISPRQWRMATVLLCCREIRATRCECRRHPRRGPGSKSMDWRRRRAAKLRTARRLAWDAFRALPEWGEPGCCLSPWVFESIRVRL